jgi:hypothetical protein
MEMIKFIEDFQDVNPPNFIIKPFMPGYKLGILKNIKP